MKNTKHFIIVGAMLLFSALSTCGFAQTKNGVLKLPPPALQEIIHKVCLSGYYQNYSAMLTDAVLARLV
ncbi:MAG TPA: hypothetical protein VK168_02245 [Saprospiraceae bacterium]|nr:hypothetical protein [Saprospiraceae bacterium]